MGVQEQFSGEAWLSDETGPQSWKCWPLWQRYVLSFKLRAHSLDHTFTKKLRVLHRTILRMLVTLQMAHQSSKQGMQTTIPLQRQILTPMVPLCHLQNTRQRLAI